MDSLFTVATITVLIALNGLFVAAEFAIVTVSPMEIGRAARGGSWSARLVQWVIAQPRRRDRYIATAQLGITLASLGLGMYGEHTLAAWIAGQLEGWGAERWIAAHTMASILAISTLTYFHIVLGEMVPKSVALQGPTRTSSWIAPVMLVIQMVAYPLVVLLNGIGNTLLRLVGVRRDDASTEHYRTPEEIGYIVRESQAGGALRKGSAELLGDLLEFGDLTATEVMVPRVRVVGIPSTADAAILRDTLGNAPHTRYPVYDRTLDNIVGMLHVRDALRAIRAGSLQPDQIRPIPHVPETARVDEVLEAMRVGNVQMVVVMEEHGGTGGIVTLEDLFEEVVGDLSERSGETRATRQDGGVVTADGTLRVDELGEELGVMLDHPEVDTVSGLVLSLLGRPPRVGDVVEYGPVRIQVTAIQGHGVRTVSARRA